MNDFKALPMAVLYIIGIFYGILVTVKYASFDNVIVTSALVLMLLLMIIGLLEVLSNDNDDDISKKF